MKPLIRSLLLAAILSAGLFALPAGASLVLSDFSIQPNTYPLTPMAVVNATADGTLQPVGDTTFQEGHRLQMQTGLLNATWDTRIYVDGVPGARQQASGASAFISGYLLSYGKGHDVSFLVTVRGTVPDTPGQQALLLTIAELDNSGSLVTDSPSTVTVPVAAPVTVTSVKRTARATTPPAEETTTTPTEAGVGGAIPVIAFGATAALMFFSRKGQDKR